MATKLIIGNLIELGKYGEFDVIIHGCNCQRKMKSGLAKYIAKEFPSAMKADYFSHLTPEKKLGNFTYALVDKLAIVNAYTQLSPATKKERENGTCVLDYDALYSSLTQIASTFTGLRFGIPMIGAGLAGGNWSIIKLIIEDIFENEDCTIVIFEK
jgi:O-acetyl-ADP-ribose deacetylase (regulator of RNase III)